MPIAAAMDHELYPGTRSTTQVGTGEMVPAWSYSGVSPIPCRFSIKSANPRSESHGQTLTVEAEAIFDAVQSVSPLEQNNDTGERRQVKVVGFDYDRAEVTTYWELVSVKDLGLMGTLKVARLRKWK